MARGMNNTQAECGPRPSGSFLARPSGCARVYRRSSVKMRQIKRWSLVLDAKKNKGSSPDGGGRSFQRGSSFPIA